MITLVLVIIGLALLPAAIEVALALLVIIVPLGIIAMLCLGLIYLIS